MIYGLIDRAFLLSHLCYYQKNLELVIPLLFENGYPLNLFFEKISNRIKTLIYNNRSLNLNNNHDKNNNCSDEMNKKVIVIPYIKKISESVIAIIDKSKYITGQNTSLIESLIILKSLSRFTKIPTTYSITIMLFIKSRAVIAMPHTLAKQRGK